MTRLHFGITFALILFVACLVSSTMLLATAITLVTFVMFYAMHSLGKICADFFVDAVKDIRTKKYTNATWKLFFATCFFAAIALVMIFGFGVLGLLLGVV